MLLVLTATTGVVDAVSYLALGNAFTALQTGNLVILGFALAGTGGFAVLPPLVALGSFGVGAAAGGRLATHRDDRHRRWFSLSLIVEALLVAAAALVLWWTGASRMAPQLVAVGLLGAAMGLRTATVRLLPARDANTTVLTSAIAGLAADLATTRGMVRPAWQLAMILARLAGAVAGAVLVRDSAHLPLFLAAGLIGLVGLAYVAPVLIRAHRGRRVSES